MIGTKCPGQDMRYWTPEDVCEIPCPECGEMIEFFKTDIRLRCRNCKTRVANPKFNMGCAQWCAYAEQCLGPAARGLKTKSLKEVLSDELKRLAGDQPDKLAEIETQVKATEEKCRKEKLDMLPVIAAIIVLSLHSLGLVEDIDTYLDQLSSEHNLPAQAIQDTKEQISEMIQLQH
jgi:hypothetical protein